MNKPEVLEFLDLVPLLRQDVPFAIPVLRDLAALTAQQKADLPYSGAGVLWRRINRRYLRLCRLQEELGRLDFKQAASGVSAEDYVFSRIDFKRYGKIDEKEFNARYLEGLGDFEDTLLVKNLGLTRDEIISLIEKNYEKNGDSYLLRKENPVILSVMRALDTSLESLPLFTQEEIRRELTDLYDFIYKSTNKTLPVPLQTRNAKQFFQLLVHCLNDVTIAHEDGMKTTLFMSPQGDLSGTFRPGNKPWTLVLIPIN